MSDSLATLSVDIFANDKVSAVLSKLDTQLDRTNASAARAGKGIGQGIGGGTQQAASGALALQQAQARLEAQQGNLAAAADRLRNTLAQQTTTTTQTIAVQRQLVAVEAAIEAAANKAAQAALQEAQSLARLQAASGNTAGAIQTLTNAQSKLAAGSTAFNNVGASIAKLESGKTAFQQFGSAATSSLLSIAGPAAAASAAIGGAIGVVQSFADAFKFKADLDATTASINAQLKGVRDTSQVYAQAAAFANQFKLTQQETTEAVQASIGVMRASKAPVEDILGVLARMQVLSPEQSLQEAAVALKALASGDTTSLVTRFEVGRDVANEMKAEIQGGADAVAVMSKFLGDTGIGMDALAAKAAGASGAMKDVAIAQEQLALAQAEFAQGPGLKALEVQTQLTTGLTRLLGGGGGIAEGLATATAAFQANIAAQHAYSDALLAGQTVTQAQATAQAAYAASLQSQAQAQAQAAVEQQANAAATAAYDAALTQTGSTVQANAAYEAAHAASLQASSAAAMQTSTAFDAYRQAQVAGAEATAAALAGIQALTGELSTNAQAAVLAGAQQAAQSQATANLKAQTDAAVSSFLALNPSIDGAGIAAAVAAGKIPALIGQLASMKIAAYSAADAMAALAAQQAINTKVLAAPGVGAVGRSSGANNSVDAVLKLQKANTDAAEARANQVRTLGTQQEQLNQAEKDYAAAVKASGVQSAAAINAETKLKQERLAAAKAATKGGGSGGGGAGGTTKLSDQQKLNNSLLASQESYAQKAESAEQAHLNKILKINADAAEKLKQAQDSFTQSQLEGRAGFYDSLGDIEDQGLRQALAAQYEAAFQEADAIAKEKGADVGEKFLEAKQAAIQAQAQRANEIAEATKAGDEGKAEYLAGVDKLYREAEERKLAAIKEGQGSIQSEQQAAIAEEGESYAAAQEKIGTAADQAAAKKVLAAERAGAAVDAEGLKVDALAAKYDTLAGASARAGIVPGASVTTTPTDAPVAAAPGQTNDAIAAAINGMRSLLSSIESAVNKSGDKVASAVKSIPRSVA